MKLLDGKLFGQMLLNGYLDLKQHCQEVNDLNVFPVPDGDTGFNMLETIKGGVDAIIHLESNDLGEIADKSSSGMLFSARGNSGVILSQFFAGLATGIGSDKQESPKEFAASLERAVDRAYQVVNKPTEGTILTVMRVGCANARNKLTDDSTFEMYFGSLVYEMREALKQTPELLPILKDAGVIDSGGAGLVYIIEGMASVISGKIIEELDEELIKEPNELSFDKFNEESKLDYGYCTEFILQLLNDRDGVKKFSLEELIAYYETLGDSIVAFRNGNLVKVHVHTKTPSKVIDYAQQFGEFVKFKMENMALQHNNVIAKKEEIKKPAKRHYEIASAAVSPKEFANIFKDYGITYIIESDELMNPNVNDFLRFFEEVEADNYIVLPNNKNEWLIASQAVELSKLSNVYIVKTYDLCSGIAVASILDLVDISFEENITRANNELEKVMSLKLLKAAKDSVYENVVIKENDYVGIKNGKIVCASSDLKEAWGELLSICKEQNEDLNLLTTYIFETKDSGIAGILEEKALEIDDFLEIYSTNIAVDNYLVALAIFE